MDKISPKTKKEEYIIENRDYLLIQAIRNLTIQIKRLVNK